MSLIDDTYALIAPRGRSIGFIVPDVTIEEVHQDETFITLHPVEIGAAITDHAFLGPARVEIRCGFSNSSAGTEGWVQEVYQRFLELRAEREPFSVSTGKRQYEHMLIRSLNVVTDERSEYALFVQVGLQEVLLAQAQGGGARSSGRASNSDQADPASTGTVQNRGEQPLIPVDPNFFGTFSPTPLSPSGGLFPNGQPLIGGISSNATLFGQFTPSL